MRWSWVGMVVLALAACERDRAPRHEAPDETAPEASRPAVPEQPRDLSRMPPEPAEAGSPGRPCPDGTELRERDDGDEREVECVDAAGRAHGPRSLIWDGMMPERFHTEHAAGKLHGRCWFAFYDGRFQQGAVAEYDHGRPVVEHSYLDGRRTDTKHYDDAGELAHHVTWHPNGRKASEMSVRDERLHGPATTWYASGQKASEGRFADGDEVGDWRYWDPQGKPITEDEQTAFATAQ